MCMFRAVNEKTDVEMHNEHPRELLGLMRKYKLYANLKKGIFGASEIPVLGCLVGKNGVHPDPEKSVSMVFVFGLPRDSRWKIGIVVFVDRFNKMVHLAAVAAEVTSVQTARLFVDMVFKHHGMPNDFVSDRDPRFTARFWQEELNRVLVDLLKRYAQSFH
ncbi:reverse transcriptase, partial [Phytophthora megakarya]